jgi:predicted nucleotidyltransferase
MKGGVRMCNKSTLQAVLAQVFHKVCDTFGGALNSTILFGSYARGDYDADSDIDIMVLVDMPAGELAAHRKAISEFSTDLDLEYGVFTSIKLQDLSTFDKWKDTLPFYQKILAEGVPVSA